MKLRPEDRAKAGILIVAIVVVIFFVYSRLGGSAPAPTEQPPVAPGATTPPAATSGAGPPIVGQNAPKTATNLEDLDMNAPVPEVFVRDPFEPKVRKSNVTQQGTYATGNQGGGAPGPGMQPMPGDMQVFADPESAGLIEVKGVVVGSPGYAIIKQGDKVLYLTSGESLTKDIRLISVTEAGVSLRVIKKTMFVAVGGSKQPGGIQGPTVASVRPMPVSPPPAAPLPPPETPQSSGTGLPAIGIIVTPTTKKTT